MAKRHIVASGGIGPSGDADGGLRRYLLGLARRPRPRVLLIPTASGDSDFGIARFYEALAGVDCEPRHLGLFQRAPGDLRELICAQDVIWVGGGNTVNMLAIWRLHGVDEFLREAWEAGVVLSGGSAGALCWFQAGITDSFGPHLEPLHDGLGLLAGSFCPHYDSEERRRPVLHQALREGLPAGYAADDHALLHFEDRTLARPLSVKAGARVLRVAWEGGQLSETELETIPLSKATSRT